MDGICSLHGNVEKYIQNICPKSRKHHVEELGAEENLMIKWI
jgi:hypothetical protein